MNSKDVDNSKSTSNSSIQDNCRPEDSSKIADGSKTLGSIVDSGESMRSVKDLGSQDNPKTVDNLETTDPEPVDNCGGAGNPSTEDNVEDNNAMTDNSKADAARQKTQENSNSGSSISGNTGMYKDTGIPYPFTLPKYVEDVDTRLFKIGAGRRELCRHDPLMFAIIYLPHHLKSDATMGITLSEFHVELIEYAKEWIKPLRNMGEFRDAFIAPRECGKSTWLFLILPLWSAAYGHLDFVAAFADAAKQAEQHLSTFKNELDNNSLLKQDFPSLCEPKVRPNANRVVSDNKWMIHQANDFVFTAKGIDSASLGMKVGNRRPQLLILDDIEPGESNYSAYQIDQRLKTVQDVIFPLNNFARVVISGTTTMPGSIIHQLVDGQEAWIKDENINVHYFPAILEDEEGEERSVWPEKWSMEMLDSIRHTRSFMKNFMNRPLTVDGQYWGPEDFLYGEADFYGNTILSIDPAVTSNKVSDFTGFSVISRGAEGNRGEVFVRYADHKKLTPQGIRAHINDLLDQYPEIGLILIETNQGGDVWKEMLINIPCKVKTIHNNLSKNLRAQKALDFYQKKRVVHTRKFGVCEEEMLGFPNTLHDDTLDAVVTGVLYFLANKQGKVKVRQGVYI